MAPVLLPRYCMPARSTQFITESFLTLWLEESERSRSGQHVSRMPVTRLCHPLRDMLAINAGGEIVGNGLRMTGARAHGGTSETH